MAHSTWSAETFVRDGFVHLPGAFDPALAATCRDLLWARIDADPHDPSTWTEPVVRIEGMGDEPFTASANTLTRIRVGSHLDVAALLEPHGDVGAEFFAFACEAVPATEHRPVVDAVGAAGDVYLVHPFVVHSAQPHRGTRPRFMAQPPLEPVADLDLDRPAGDHSAVERAVLRGLTRPCEWRWSS